MTARLNIASGSISEHLAPIRKALVSFRLLVIETFDNTTRHVRLRLRQGTEQDQKETKSLDKSFAADRLVREIEADPEWQSYPYSDGTEKVPFVQHDDPFMSEVMSGSSRVTSKCYINKSKAMLCFMVYFGGALEWNQELSMTVW